MTTNEKATAFRLFRLNGYVYVKSNNAQAFKAFLDNRQAIYRVTKLPSGIYSFEKGGKVQK